MILMLHTYIVFDPRRKKKNKKMQIQLIMTQATIVGKSKSRVLIIPYERKHWALGIGHWALVLFLFSLFKKKG